LAVSLRATVDEGSRFEQITPDSSPTPIDVIRSPVDCLLQYSDDGRHLYYVTFRKEDYVELELTVYDPAQGRQHAKRSYQQYGLRSTNDFRNLMLQTQDLVEFKGEYLVICSAARSTTTVFLWACQSIASSLSTKGISGPSIRDPHTLQLKYCRVDSLLTSKGKRLATHPTPTSRGSVEQSS